MASLRFRAARLDEGGIEFRDYLYARSAAKTDTPTQARALAERMWIFIEQYDHLRDDGGDEPTVAQYADRWRLPLRSAHRAFSEFGVVFASEPDAGRV